MKNALEIILEQADCPDIKILYHPFRIRMTAKRVRVSLHHYYHPTIVRRAHPWITDTAGHRTPPGDRQ